MQARRSLDVGFSFCCPLMTNHSRLSLQGVERNGKSYGRKLVSFRMCASMPTKTTNIRPLRSPPPRFYNFSPDDIESVKVRHIRVLTELVADEAMRQIRSGTAVLKELASTLSVCEASKQNGGDLGWWDVDEQVPNDVEQFGMCDELLGACARTRANTLCKVQSKHGWHVYVVEDVRHKLNVQRRTVNPVRRQRKQGETFPEPIARTYHIASLGCQMNLADKERMAGELDRLGYTFIEDPFASSVFVLNTCSIREHAESKVYSALGRHSLRKQLSPGKVTLCVSGCVAQQEGEKLLRRIPELDLVLGPQYSGRLGDLLDDVQQNHCQVSATQPIHIQEDLSKPRRGSPTTAWLNVIYGCNERCTYCVVPFVRGLEQSRPMDSIRQELEEIAASGRRECTLLGQNIDSYGRDLYPKKTFSDLLQYLHDVEGIERIRFTTSHPRYMSTRLIETCASLPKVCESFHIPPQSGDNAILKAMGRGYTAERFKNIVANIREKIPDAGIGGDVIVGFPGETEDQFQRTMELLHEVQFDMLNTAAYSPRPNTPAAVWDNQVPESVKADRLARINQACSAVALERSKRFVGRVEEVLVEEVNPRNASQVMGRNRANRIVRFDGDINLLRNKLVKVRILEAMPYSLVGSAIGEPY